MRKIRNAALVAAVLGSVSMFGAGIAVASDGWDGKDTWDGNLVICEQVSQVSGGDTYQTGLINIIAGPDTAFSSGPATAVAVQQICSGDDTLAENEAEAETGPGVAVLNLP